MHKAIQISLSAVLIVSAFTQANAQKPTQKSVQQTPPPPMKLEPVRFPAFAERTLSNGAQIVVVENHEQPVVSVNVYLPGAGLSAEPEGKVGVADITAALLESGTKTRTSKEIAEALEGMGAQLSTSAGVDWATIGVTALKNDIDAALAIVADVLLNPTFPDDEFETERKRRLTALQVQLSQPAQLASRHFQSRVFGQHPYGRLTTTSSLRAITRADLVAFHNANYKPSNALIVVAGDVDPADITARLQKQLAGWTGSSPNRPQFTAAATRTQPELVLVNKPGAVQAAFRIGHTIVPATHPDWAALVVAQQVLGGGSKGWLFDILREQKGFTYGAYAQAVQRLDPGYFQMSGDVRNEVADSAMALFLELAERLKTQPVPAQDLELAKNWLTGSFPLTIETPSQVAGQVASARLLRQPKDHVQTWRRRLAAVTAADVQRVARTHIQPDRFVIVVSGDASVLKPKLEKFGRIEVVDEEGRPVTQSDMSVKPTALAIDASSITPQTLSYTVTAQGNPIAEMTRVVTRENVAGKDVIKSVSTMSGMITMSQELLVEAKTFAPISSTMSQTMGPQTVKTDLKLTGSKITGSSSGPQGDKTIDAPYVEGTLLPGMDEFALWLADFSKQKELTLAAFNPQSSTVVPITIKVVGESKTKVAAGEFDTYELEMQTAQGGMKLYLRKAAPHILIKQEYATQPVAVELKAIK